MLYPSETNLERMQNRRMLESLAEQGDEHEVPRKIEHWLYFGDEASRAACRDTLVAIDFAVEDEGMAEEEGDGHAVSRSWCRASTAWTRTPSTASRSSSQRLAGEYCARYDGWECAVTRAGSHAVVAGSLELRRLREHHGEVVGRHAHDLLALQAVARRRRV